VEENGTGGISATARGSGNSVQLSLSACILSGNSAFNFGDGTFSDGSNGGSAGLSLNDCTISDNSANLGGRLIF